MLITFGNYWQDPEGLFSLSVLGTDKYRREEAAALLTEEQAIQQILQMASLCLTQLVIAAINTILLILFVAANTDFSGSVFETRVGK